MSSPAPGSAARRGAALAMHLRGRPLADALLAAGLGALQTLAFVATTLAWWLPPACIALLAWRVFTVAPRRAALLGAAFGTGWVAAGTWWLFISMHRYGGLPAPLAAAAVALLALALSAYLALALAAVARLRRGPIAHDAALFAVAWLTAELARGLVASGFPWGASGYAQVDGPLAGWAPWIGVYGIGALAAGLAAWPAAWVARQRGAPQRPTARGGLFAALALVVVLVPGLAGALDFTRPTGRLKVTLLQPNVAQDEKFASRHLPATLAWVAVALRSAEGDLVVAPETAVPLLPDQLQDFDAGYWPVLTEHFRQPGRPVALVGVPLGDLREGYTNSVVALDAGPAGYRYDKTHLVPFGEFIPSGFRWFTDMMQIPLGDFNRGPLNAPSYRVQQERVAPNICYEDLFGEELALRFADPVRAPTVLVNISNIGWFGNTIAVTQHLNISRLRTLELQRPMLRATNTGATAIIDHRGRVTAQLAPFTEGVLQGAVQGREGRTPYAVWVGAVGWWPVLGLCVALLAFGAWRRRGAPPA